LNLNISASSQNMKKLIVNFGAIHVRIIYFFEYALRLAVIIKAHWVVLIFFCGNLPGQESNLGCWDGNPASYHCTTLHANFQASSFTGVGGEWGDRRTDTGRQAFLSRFLCKISKLLPRFVRCLSAGIDGALIQKQLTKWKTD